MNNKGWSLNEMFVLVGILATALALVAIMYTNFFKDVASEKKLAEPVKEVKVEDNQNTVIATSSEIKLEKSDYILMETNMIEASKRYVFAYYIGTSEPVIHISYNQLFTSGYLELVQPALKECSGYVTYTLSSMNYKAYIDCGTDYQTDGYQFAYDEKIHN